MRNERQYLRLFVLGFVTEPAHSGMPPSLPIPVETLAPPFDCERTLYSVDLFLTHYRIFSCDLKDIFSTSGRADRAGHLPVGFLALQGLALVM